MSSDHSGSFRFPRIRRWKPVSYGQVAWYGKEKPVTQAVDCVGMPQLGFSLVKVSEDTFLLLGSEEFAKLIQVRQSPRGVLAKIEMGFVI
jgi:hypothetical protein